MPKFELLPLLLTRPYPGVSSHNPLVAVSAPGQSALSRRKTGPSAASPLSSQDRNPGQSAHLILAAGSQPSLVARSADLSPPDLHRLCVLLTSAALARRIRRSIAPHRLPSAAPPCPSSAPPRPRVPAADQVPIYRMPLPGGSLWGVSSLRPTAASKSACDPPIAVLVSRRAAEPPRLDRMKCDIIPLRSLLLIHIIPSSPNAPLPHPPSVYFYALGDWQRLLRAQPAPRRIHNPNPLP